MQNHLVCVFLNNIRRLESSGETSYKLRLGEMFNQGDFMKCCSYLDDIYSIHVSGRDAVVSWSKK